MTHNTTSTSHEELSKQLFQVIRQLIVELHPHQRQLPVTQLDSSLDVDLGLDSLARVELISRLEQHFGVTLPQAIFVNAESPRDLLTAIIQAGRSSQPYRATHEIAAAGEEVEDLPTQAGNLVEVLHWHVQRHPDRLHIRLLDEDDEEHTLTYSQLWQGAKSVAAGLQQNGILPGDTVAIMLPTSIDYFYSFFGILLAGAVPVPIYPPVRRSQLEDHLYRHTGILNNSASSLLITVSEAKLVAKLLKSQVTTLRQIVTVPELKSRTDAYQAPAVSPTDLAFLQYTSGSTGKPKGVMLTHFNLLTNIRAMGKAVKADSRDVFVSWLPLYHDMGLIGAWLGSLYFAVQLVVMSPLTFITRPRNWLWAIHRYHGTLSASPNFGYELLLKRISEDDLKGMDLSSWRLAFNGAEPISPTTMQRFVEWLEPAGFREEAMLPVYGLAESAVGLAFPPLDSKPVVDCVQREELSSSAQALPAQNNDSNALCFVGCGRPLAGHQVRVVDDAGHELPERHEGHLQFQGPSATSGYYRNPEATRKLFDGDWLDSGDTGYIAGGDIFVTGRSKDIIIRGGRNIYPQELEEAIGEIEGIRKGCIAVFPATDPYYNTERMVLVAETRESEAAAKAKLKNMIRERANDLVGIPPDEVILAPPHTVLKTSSGKIRRAATRSLYESGELGKSTRAVWRQLLHSLQHSVIPLWRKHKQQLGRRLYAAYAWSLFGVLGFITWSAIVCLPTLRIRWRVLQFMSRSLVRLAGIRLMVNGEENLLPPEQGCVYVANHSSYLDSIVIVGAIPRMFKFVAKAEFLKKPLARLFMRRLGTEFVERFDSHKGVIDAERITDAAHRQESLFFFPEGTFSRMPGLTGFHMGAFLSAARTGMPVIPIAIRGTRSILRADFWFPQRGHIIISVGEAIRPDRFSVAGEDDWHTALQLRDAARKFILRNCGEPDLPRDFE